MMITIQKSGVQRLFDHSVYLEYQNSMSNFTDGLMKSLISNINICTKTFYKI